MLVDGGYEDFSGGHGRRAQTTAELGLPGLPEFAWDGNAGLLRCGPRRADRWASRRRRHLDRPTRPKGGALVQPGHVRDSVFAGLWNRPHHQGLEARQLGLELAAAGVHRCVGHAVAGHHAVDAPTAEPVVRFPMLRLEIDELGTVSRRQDVVVGGLGRIAAMVKPVNLYVWREFSFDFAGERIVAGEHST